MNFILKSKVNIQNDRSDKKYTCNNIKDECVVTNNDIHMLGMLREKEQLTKLKTGTTYLS